MKKIYFFICMMVMSLFAISANAQTKVIVNVDDPERVDIEVNYASVEGIVAGDNEVEIPQYASFNVKAKRGCALQSVRCTTTGSDVYISNLTQAYVYVNPSSDELLRYEVQSTTMEALRTATVTINVDDASQVNATLNTTYERLSLVNGDNTVKFIPGVESPISIAHANSGNILYQVLLNEEEVPAQGTNYSVNVSDGNTLTIKANFPEDLVYPIHFNYVNKGTEGAVSTVTVNGESVTNFNDENFTVPAGKQVSITFNIQDYQLNSFKVNGETAYTYGGYQFFPTGETTLDIDATKYADFNCTLNIDHAENVTVYKGYTYNNDIISVVDGDNTLTLTPKSNTITIKPNSGCKIESISDNLGSTFYTNYNGEYEITMSENQTVTVITSAIVRNDVLTVNLDDETTAINYFSFARADRSEITLKKGANEVKFNSDDNPFGMSFYDYNNVTTAFLNGVKTKPYYEGGSSYQLTFTNGDVLDVFFVTEVSPLAVTFTCNDEGVAANTTVSVDGKGAAIDYWANGLSVMSGTVLSIAPAGGTPIYVMNGEEVLTPEADGSYKVTVTEATALTLSSTSLTGIEEVTATSAADKNAIYNLQGVKVANRADALRNLPAGIYVVGGKKVMK